MSAPAAASRRSPGIVARALWTGALAGLVAGAIDALFSWKALGQFVPGAPARLEAALLSGALDAVIAGPAVAAVAALGILVFGHTALGGALRHGLATHE